MEVAMNREEKPDNKIEIKCSEAMRDKIKIIIEGQRNTVQIEECVEIADQLTIHIVDDDNVVYIGKGSTFEETSIAVADCHNYVRIGEDCMFARNTNIMASDFHSIVDMKTGQRKNLSKGVCIQNHVWVGYGAAILKNTYIDANSIIGAGAFVHGYVPANSIYPSPRGGPEVTWERSRQTSMMPMKSCLLRRTWKWKTIRLESNIIFSIENDIVTCFNKIKGWAFWKGKDSTNAKLYIYCIIRSSRKRRSILIPLSIVQRNDVAETFGDKRYLNSGFEAYMPAYIIQRKKEIEKVELLMNVGKEWGKQRIM